MSYAKVAFWAKVALWNILILVTLLCAAELAYRTSHPKQRLSVRTFPGETANRDLSWARPNPELGWVFNKTNTFTLPGWRNYNKWTANINHDGFRAKIDFDDIGPKGNIIRIMVLGDSFTFGTYINDSETLTSLLEEKLGAGYEVYNFGIPGWGIDQMYLSYKMYAERIDPDFVVVVYIDDDVSRAFESFRVAEGMNKPSFTVIDGLLRSRDESDRSGILEWIAKRSFIANKFYKVFKASECLAIAKALFSELSRETRQRGQRLIVVRYPYQEEIYNKKNNWESYDLKEFFERKGITYLDPTLNMRIAAEMTGDFYLKLDGHPAKAGNDFVSGYIIAKTNIRETIRLNSVSGMMKPK